MARPLDPELLSFLQTLVAESSGPQHERTDSDKENGAGPSETTEEIIAPNADTHHRNLNEDSRLKPEIQISKFRSQDMDSAEDIREENNNEVDDDGKGKSKKILKKKKKQLSKRKPPPAPSLHAGGGSSQSPALKDDLTSTHQKTGYGSVGDRISHQRKSRSPDQRKYSPRDDQDTQLKNRQDSDLKNDHSQKQRDSHGLDQKDDHSSHRTKNNHSQKQRDGHGIELKNGHGPDQRDDHSLNQTDDQSSMQDTMSDTNPTSRKKLSRRKQITRPHCAGPEPKGDVLVQKYQELHQLMITPLVHMSNTHKLSTEQLQRMYTTNQLYTACTSDSKRKVFVELTQDNTDEGYSPMRNAQVLSYATDARRPQSAHRPQTSHRPQTAHSARRRPLSAVPHRKLSHSNTEQHVNKQGAPSNENLHVEKKEKNNRRNSNFSNVSGDDAGHGTQEQKRSRSHSPKLTDTHLKNSTNPELKKWLKMKEKELRKKKSEERKKAKEERLKKQEEEKARQEQFKDSGKVVEEWMIKKRKEALQHAKEERKRQKEEEKYLAERNSGKVRPVSAPNFNMVVRPESSREITHNEDGTVAITPRPPPTKFVYKRPVTGRVRLMKLQQEKKDDAKKSELQAKLFEKKLAEEKSKKMRVSYDQWLLKKREEDYAKRQEAARLRALAKSDPELERIMPELAKKRIENIQRGKKRIDTGIRRLDERLNKSFGGGSFLLEEEVDASNQLKISGSKTNLSSRPTSARPDIGPTMSKSPRRPTSANPNLHKAVATNPINAPIANNANPFKVPFPPEEGAPKHVLAKQSKLFAPYLSSSSSSSKESDSISMQESLKPDEMTPPHNNEATTSPNFKTEEVVDSSQEAEDLVEVTESLEYFDETDSEDDGSESSRTVSAEQESKADLQASLEDEVLFQEERALSPGMGLSQDKRARSPDLDSSQDKRARSPDLGSSQDKRAPSPGDLVSSQDERALSPEDLVYSQEERAPSPTDQTPLQEERAPSHLDEVLSQEASATSEEIKEQPQEDFVLEGDQPQSPTDHKSTEEIQNILKLNLDYIEDKRRQLDQELDSYLDNSRQFDKDLDYARQHEDQLTERQQDLSEKEDRSNLSESKNFSKHVSFQEEPVIYEAADNEEEDVEENNDVEDNNVPTRDSLEDDF